MKNLIRKILKEETEEVFEIPGLDYFPDEIEGLRRLIEKKNIKRWSLDDDLTLIDYEGDLSFLDGLVSIKGYLDLMRTSIKSLGNLEYVGGFLSLYETNIKSLGNLKHVGGYLYLYGTPIKSIENLRHVVGELDLRGTSIESIENLEYVGGDLYLNKVLSKKYTDEEIRSQVTVVGKIYREK